MENLRVTQVDTESIAFDNGAILSSYHASDCCEYHWLSFADLTLEDFEGLRFNLSNDLFFNRIDGYGIELIPIQGHSVKVPGYGSNNGYYSDQLDLILSSNEVEKRWDISDCQVIDG